MRRPGKTPHSERYKDDPAAVLILSRFRTEHARAIRAAVDTICRRDSVRIQDVAKAMRYPQSELARWRLGRRLPSVDAIVILFALSDGELRIDEDTGGLRLPTAEEQNELTRPPLTLPHTAKRRY